MQHIETNYNQIPTNSDYGMGMLAGITMGARDLMADKWVILSHTPEDSSTRNGYIKGYNSFAFILTTSQTNIGDDE